MSDFILPADAPIPGRLEVPALKLVVLLRELTDELDQRRLALLSLSTSGDGVEEFATVVHRTAATLSNAAEGWTRMSATIRGRRSA